jgi:SH3 domain
MIHQATRFEVASRKDRAGVVQVTQDRSWTEAKAEGQGPHLDGEGDRRGREATRDWTNPISHTRPSSTKTLTSLSGRSHSEMSPPLTPRGSRQAFGAAYEEEPEATFHNYLRAFYHFHPSSTVSSSGDESSITVPINQGDVILVHSVHPNGWADGTLLGSGARGWLPTNYCEPYDHPSVRNLLTALTHLWDLVRSNEHETLVVFSRQDYVRGMIAGVRFFLVSYPF